MDLIKSVFPEKDAKVLEKLWYDDSSPQMRLMIARQVGKKLNPQGVMLSSTRDQLLALLSQAEFANSDSEVVYVAGVLMHVLPKKDILPFVAEQKGYELASRCLVSLGLFIKHMYHKQDIMEFQLQNFIEKLENLHLIKLVKEKFLITLLIGKNF